MLSLSRFGKENNVNLPMYSSLQLGFKYLGYYLKASNGKGHGVHSPFVFDFIKSVLNGEVDPEIYKNVEDLRKKLLCDETILTIDDYGAGSSSNKSSQRTVASVARRTVKSKKYGQLLYRFVKYYQPKTIIELGTSLGITTVYLSLANPDSKLFTLEGAGKIAKIARENFKGPECGNIRLIEGNFDNTLPAVLYQLANVDFAFIDGNHRRQPTENYFQWLLAKANNDSIFIFDDIHWSKEMEQAWNNIKEHPAVRCTVDVFFLGIVFFRNEFKEKQHFTIRF
jgi:predicted O-methyltransferase YrrM